MLLPSFNRARVGLIFALVMSDAALTSAQESSSTFSEGWQREDWFKPAADQQQTAFGGTFSKSTEMGVANPFDVISSGSLWQEKYRITYQRPLSDFLSLDYEMRSVSLNDTIDPMWEGDSAETKLQKAELQFKPMEGFTLSGDVHDSMNEASLSADSIFIAGTGVTAETHLPLNSIFTMGVTSNTTHTSVVASSQNTGYNAQFQQPLGKIPLTAVFKGHYEETDTSGTTVSRMPSLEQSLVWKPAGETTLQVGLRQQQYQDFPGISHALNEAVFADWSQKFVDDLTWHSYAEMLNSRSTIEIASPGLGANGTAQPTLSGSNAGLSSSLPVSVIDETLTFSTGPSFQLQKDISASIEYSNRWDQAPVAGAVGQEQRVSLSLKGTF